MKRRTDQAFVRTGMLTAIVANFTKAKDDRPYTAMDFVPGHEPPPPQDGETMLALFEAMATAHNEKLKQEGKL